MALTTCPECKKQISDSAISCVHCGKPLRKTRMDILADIKRVEEDREYWNQRIDEIRMMDYPGQYGAETLQMAHKNMAEDWDKLRELYASLRKFD
jgi:predicted amidophosphoribosyltransferase